MLWEYDTFGDGMGIFRPKNILQLLGAGLFVFLGLCFLIVLFSRFFPDGPPVWLLVPMVLIGFFGLIFLAMLLFHGKGPSRVSAEKSAARIQRLEEEGFLEHQTFRARRAFQIDEFEDEGSSYFVELDNGAVLFLTGQYLYDYEPGKKSLVSTGRLRTFPTTEFTVRRHKESGYTIDIVCRGSVLEPEVVAPWFDEDDFKSDRIPLDASIIRDKTYDQIKADRLKRK